MQFQISRNGQMYGPYTLEDLQRYVGMGNVLLTDMAKADGMADWMTVSQVLSSYGAPAAISTVPSAFPSNATFDGAGSFNAGPYAAAPSASALAASPYPDAPNLHWALLLLLTIVTCGLFFLVYDIIVLLWLRKVQPNSTALWYFIGSVAISIVNQFISIGAGLGHHSPSVLSFILSLAAWVVGLIGIYSERASLEQHFNTAEPVGLQLNPVMTFFFSAFYFQYHLNRINEMKKMARMGGGMGY